MLDAWCLVSKMTVDTVWDWSQIKEVKAWLRACTGQCSQMRTLTQLLQSMAMATGALQKHCPLGKIPYQHRQDELLLHLLERHDLDAHHLFLARYM